MIKDLLGGLFNALAPPVAPADMTPDEQDTPDNRGSRRFFGWLFVVVLGLIIVAGIASLISALI